METERGAALILALMILCFLAVVAGALLTTSTIDIWVGDNYKVGTQLVYLAEAGIEEAREALRTWPYNASQLLATASGADGVLSGSRDLATLLGKTDDIPLVNGGDRATGKLLIDLFGRAAGRYFVFLRNDPADGVVNVTDTNQALTLLSFGVIGNASRAIESTVMKFSFPKLPAALTLDGSPAVFQPVDSDGFGISGVDPGSGGRESAVGVISAADQTGVLQAIPEGRQVNYPGNALPVPPPGDVAVVETALDLRLKSPSRLEGIVETILANSTNVYSPAVGEEVSLGAAGSSSAASVITVNGDCSFGSGAGFGMLLVRGNLTIHGSFSWTGLILVIGQGSMRWVADADGQVAGGVFLARTRDNDRSSTNPLGTMRSSRGPVSAVFLGGASNAIQLNLASIIVANAGFPYLTIASREY
jgi:hypothetical protein